MDVMNQTSKGSIEEPFNICNSVPVINMYDSLELIGEFEARLEELKDKGFERRSFYHGWLEGRIALIKELTK